MRLRQRLVSAVIWDSTKNATLGVCNITQLVDRLWENADTPNLVNQMKQPVSNYFDSGFRGKPAGLKYV